VRVTSSEAATIVRSVLGRGLTFEQADQIIKAMVPVSAEPGMVVMREGERGRGLLVLLEGSAEVLKQGRDGGEMPIASVEAPTVLGEMSLITSGRTRRPSARSPPASSSSSPARCSTG